MDKELFNVLILQHPECEEEITAIYNDLEYKKQKNEK